MMKYLILFGVIYAVYKYSDVISRITGPNQQEIDDSNEEYTDYEEVD
ncbi:MAG: hypothetical protein V3V14_01805 [Saprospiraceae bacterium]